MDRVVKDAQVHGLEKDTKLTGSWIGGKIRFTTLKNQVGFLRMASVYLQSPVWDEGTSRDTGTEAGDSGRPVSPQLMG